MGLTLNTTLEQEFGFGMKGDSVISANLTSNRLTINYSPKIHVDEEYFVRAGCIRTRSGVTTTKGVKSRRVASDALHNNYASRAVAGFEQWDTAKNGRSISVQGVPLDCIINVNPLKAAGKADADVVITAYNMGTPMVPKALFDWNTSLRAKMWLTDVKADDPAVKPNPDSTLPYYVGANNTTGDMFSNRAAHEFGHVLGLFDAYGYGQHFPLGDVVYPAAPITPEMPKNGVMRSVWNVDYECKDLDYEMLLYAWSTDSLQLYTDSFKGFKSEAFYRR